jgi:hypothetical protein
VDRFIRARLGDEILFICVERLTGSFPSIVDRASKLRYHTPQQRKPDFHSSSFPFTDLLKNITIHQQECRLDREELQAVIEHLFRISRDFFVRASQIARLQKGDIKEVSSRIIYDGHVELEMVSTVIFVNLSCPEDSPKARRREPFNLKRRVIHQRLALQ